MNERQAMLEAYRQMNKEYEKIIGGLTVEDLFQQQYPGANSMGRLLWQVSRNCDRLTAELILGKQLWISDGWRRIFNCKPDPDDSTKSRPDARVEEMKIPDARILLAYHHSVTAPLLDYLDALTEEEMRREYPNSLTPGTKSPAAEKLTGVHRQNMQYIEQAGDVRAVLKGKRCFGE